MEQLEALQKLYESITNGPDVLQGIEPDSIVGGDFLLFYGTIQKTA